MAELNYHYGRDHLSDVETDDMDAVLAMAKS